MKNFIYDIPEVIRLDINLSQLQRNLKAAAALTRPEVKLMAVVKGNAYGHGIVPVAKALETAGCYSLGVVRISEAAALREAGIKIPVMLLAPIMPSQAKAALDYDITIMLDNEAVAYEVDRLAKCRNKIVKAHVKVNTGLNRFGIEPHKALDFIKKIRSCCSSLELEGIYTHFRDPEFNKDFTHKQIAVFNKLLSELEDEGLRPPIAHAAASGGTLLYPEAHYDMVRCGILLYGEEYLKGKRIIPDGVLPLTSLVSTILKINEVEEGQPIGYGDKHIASRRSDIAVIAAGYGDGVSRGWKHVLIKGHKVPIVNYGMDCIEADITDISEAVEVYDQAVLIGPQGEGCITWEEACYGMGSEVDEQLQRITQRVPKNYYYEL